MGTPFEGGTTVFRVSSAAVFARSRDLPAASKTILIGALMAGLALIVAAPAKSQDKSLILPLIIVENKSSDTLYYLYISDIKNKEWGKEVLGKDVMIKPGEKLTRAVRGDCLFDAKAVFKSKRSIMLRNVDLCAHGTWLIRANENEYTYTRKTRSYTVKGTEGVEPPPAPPAPLTCTRDDDDRDSVTSSACSSDTGDGHQTGEIDAKSTALKEKITLAAAKLVCTVTTGPGLGAEWATEGDDDPPSFKIEWLPTKEGEIGQAIVQTSLREHVVMDLHWHDSAGDQPVRIHIGRNDHYELRKTHSGWTFQQNRADPNSNAGQCS